MSTGGDPKKPASRTRKQRTTWRGFCHRHRQRDAAGKVPHLDIIPDARGTNSSQLANHGVGDRTAPLCIRARHQANSASLMGGEGEGVQRSYRARELPRQAPTIFHRKKPNVMSHEHPSINQPRVSQLLLLALHTTNHEKIALPANRSTDFQAIGGHANRASNASSSWGQAIRNTVLHVPASLLHD